MKLVIDRSRWIRGKREVLKESDGSCLLRSIDNKMCCLGFYIKACGFDDKDILDVSTPDNLSRNTMRLLEEKSPWLLERKYPSAYISNTSDVTRLIDINDGLVRVSNREKEIARIFKKHGVEVEFVDVGGE